MLLLCNSSHGLNSLFGLKIESKLSSRRSVQPANGDGQLFHHEVQPRFERALSEADLHNPLSNGSLRKLGLRSGSGTLQPCRKLSTEKLVSNVVLDEALKEEFEDSDTQIATGFQSTGDPQEECRGKNIAAIGAHGGEGSLVSNVLWHEVLKEEREDSDTQISIGFQSTGDPQEECRGKNIAAIGAHGGEGSFVSGKRNVDLINSMIFESTGVDLVIWNATWHTRKPQEMHGKEGRIHPEKRSEKSDSKMDLTYKVSGYVRLFESPISQLKFLACLTLGGNLLLVRTGQGPVGACLTLGKQGNLLLVRMRLLMEKTAIGSVNGGFRGEDGGGHGGRGDGSGSDPNSTDTYYKKMLRADPGNPLLLTNYARFLQEVQHDLERAEEYYGRAVLASPGDGDALSLYANLIWDVHKDAPRAQYYYEQAVEAAPDDCNVLASYAHFLWDAEDDEEDAASPIHCGTATTVDN